MTDVAPERLVTSARSRSALAFVREADMLAAVAAIADRLAAGLPGHRSASSHVLFEVPAAAGIPDMLRVAFDPTELRRRSEMDLPPVLDHTSMRVLTAVAVGPALLQDLARRAAVTSAHLRRTVLPRLIEGGWLEPSYGRGDQALVVPRVMHRTLVRSVITVEAKRRDWRAAISQARRHQACADRAYIAIDAATPGRLLDLADDLARAGIGLITVEAATSRAVQVTRPAAGFPRDEERRLIGERAWSLVLSGRSTWDTFDVFGRDLSAAAS